MAMDAFSGRTPVYGVDANAEGLLGRREQEVVSLVACGLSNRGIAQKLQISEHTVKNYLFRVYEKLGISNRVELALFALSSKRRANGHRPLRQPVCRVPQSTSENLLSDPLLRA
jgi:DNA-binding NarL/FixJ family response regulator